MHDRDVFICVFMSTAKRSTMTCKHASLRPTLQVQCAQRTLLSFSTPTQGCRQGADNFYEWQTLARIKYEPTRGTLVTDTFATLPLAKKLYASKLM